MVMAGSMEHLLEAVNADVEQESTSATLIIPSSFTSTDRECLKETCAKAGLQFSFAGVCTDDDNVGLQILPGYIIEDWEGKGGDDLPQAVEEDDLPQAIEEDEWLHRGGCSWQGMDIVDLPYVLSRGEDEEVQGETQDCVWDLVDEAEKACCDRYLSSVRRKPIFSKVFVLGSSNQGAYVSIPNSYNPYHGSPSAPLKAKPTLLETAINATLRIRTTFADEDGSDHTSFGTGFLVSPNMLLTAKHCIGKENVLDIKVHGGLTVISQHFDGVGAVEASVAQLAARDCSTSKDSNGLFTHGADVGSLFTHAHFTSFLLPCSPSFLCEKYQVAIISYPGVDRFMQNAKEALIEGSVDDSAIWEQYLPTIKSLYDGKIKECAEAAGLRTEKARVTKSIVEIARKEVKQILYNELVNAFGGTHTGMMVCSVGTLLHYNKVCLATSCSTVSGSSGAAVCPISRPMDFIGIHRGGSKGFDVNCATSVDNPLVVKQYMSDVLPTLPHPKDKCWASRNMDGFNHWLGLHEAKIPRSSPWHGVAKQAKARETMSKKALKRKARG